MAYQSDGEERGEVQLTGILAEFRTALQAEIEAARRSAAASAVQLANGRRIAQVGGSYQYVFDIENALSLPGDTPGELRVPGRERLEVIIISVEGLGITLSVPADLGAFIPSARLESNLAQLMRRLIERIEASVGVPNLVGDRVLGTLPVSGEPLPVQLPCLDRHQQEATASSLGRDTTFIWGPPGTGKTRTIGAIGKQLYQTGRAVLLVSHTNAAVDQALWEIGSDMEEAELKEGRILRVGEPRDPRLLGQPELLLDTHVARRSAELVERRNTLEAERGTAVEEVKRVSRSIAICEWLAEAQRGLSAMTKDLEDVQNLEASLQQARADRTRLAASSEKWALTVNAAQEAQRCAEAIQKLNSRIDSMQERLRSLQSRVADVSSRRSAAEAVYSETTSVNWLVRAWRGLPAPEKQSAVLGELTLRLKQALTEEGAAESELITPKTNRDEFANKLNALRREYSGDPEGVFRQAAAHDAALKAAISRASQLMQQCAARRQQLDKLLRNRLAALRALGLASETNGSTETMLGALHNAYWQAASEVRGADLRELRNRRDRINEHIQALESEIREIDKALKRVAELVIADAEVVATTLTRAYLWDAIQARRFDTVILDEASMAPIPALWVAAGLADVNAVVVGDFRQLPPIVLSKHALAKKWLGRDVFEVAGRDGLENPARGRVDLRRQYRMHPAISAIPNTLIYGHSLEDDSTTTNDSDLEAWYRHDWGYDSPVVLVDTGSLNAWVTSVVRGGRRSRLNFLSATVCVDLAESLLRQDRPKLPEGERRRILIACPYRPHANLLDLLLQEQRLEEDVAAGTAHSFQGSEADVVILDLVNDDPHWRVGMFMPERDDSTIPLLNVALTRARHRLFIVGDFDYINKQARKAFLGSKLIPFLRKHYPRVEAIQVVPAGLAARAAKAQAAAIGGELEPDAARVVVTQQHFYSMFRSDIARARHRVIIYSPFVTESRLAQLGPQLRAAVERGVRVHVVTKAHENRPKTELSHYCMLERALADWGVTVVHKRGMHEKLIFVDDDVLWSGSLNPLSFRDTQEVMERRHSRRVVDDYARTLRLDDLIREYDDGTPKCPICGAEVVASEGRDKPFYWRCVQNDCYTRDIDKPPLEGAVVRCARCGGEVECGQWGRNAAWRCLRNRRHHQKVARTHLLLPKMRAIVPRQELRKLDKRFGIDPRRLHGARPDTQTQLEFGSGLS